MTSVFDLWALAGVVINAVCIFAFFGFLAICALVFGVIAAFWSEHR